MASLRTGLLILFTFLYFATLHADKPTYGPLVRHRSIARQQTSEEELNTTIGSIYQTDFKTTPATKGWHDDDKRTGRPPLELETRSSAGGSSGRRQPISPDDQSKSQHLAVVRQSDGSLTVSFAATTSWQPPTTTAYPYVPVAAVASNPLKDILVLRVAQNNTNDTMTDKEGTPFFLNSYPANYPLKKIQKLMQEKRGVYEDFFERSMKRDNLETRINSPSDQFLCASVQQLEYPTYHPRQKGNIVNVPGFFQSITIETCANHGFSCSNSNTDSDHELLCEQVYGTYTLYTVQVDDPSKLMPESLSFPSCCKCKHVPKGTGRK